jgi:hypothetical protein
MDGVVKTEPSPTFALFRSKNVFIPTYFNSQIIPVFKILYNIALHIGKISTYYSA